MIYNFNNNDDDESLLKTVQSGNTDAYRYFVEKYRQALVNSIYRLVGNYCAAEEIAQDAFFKFYLQIGKFDFKFKCYTLLYKIAVNKAFDYTRNRRNKFWKSFLSIFSEENENKCGYDDNIESELLRQESDSEVRKAIEKLSERRKTVLILKIYNNFSYRDISEIMGCSVKSVERLIAEARKELKKILGDR